MGQLKDFLGKASGTETPKARRPSLGAESPKGKYVALAVIPRNEFPDFGDDYTPIGGGDEYKLNTAEAIANAVVDLNLNGRAYFFGNGSIDGRRAKPTETNESRVYGTSTIAKPTGDITEVAEITFRDFNKNRPFFNELRRNRRAYDFLLFTNGSVELIRYDVSRPVVHAVGDEHSGNITDDVPGGINITYGQKGQLEPFFGDFEPHINENRSCFTWGTITPTTLVSTLGGTVFTMTAGAGGKIARAIAEDVESGAVAYSIFKDVNSPIPSAEVVSINSSTGEVTVGNGMTAGLYYYKVVAENKTGVLGEWDFAIKVAPAPEES